MQLRKIESQSDKENKLSFKIRNKLFNDKRGILGLQTVESVVISFLILVVTVIAVFLALNALQNAGIFTAGSTTANNTNTIINNVTSGSTAFFSITPTVFTILGVVVLMTIIGILILVVRRASGSSGGSDL